MKCNPSPKKSPGPSRRRNSFPRDDEYNGEENTPKKKQITKPRTRAGKVQGREEEEEQEPKDEYRERAQRRDREVEQLQPRKPNNGERPGEAKGKSGLKWTLGANFELEEDRTLFFLTCPLQPPSLLSPPFLLSPSFSLLLLLYSTLLISPPFFSTLLLSPPHLLSPLSSLSDLSQILMNREAAQKMRAPREARKTRGPREARGA
jgi:hypothetical protein